MARRRTVARRRGSDRIVMLLADEPNIREVVLCSRLNQKAEDLMMNAPAPVSLKQLRELNIRLAEQAKGLMTIGLGEYEKGAKVDGDYEALLARCRSGWPRYRSRISSTGGAAAAIILFEGWDARGKGGIIQRLTAEWDPRSYEVWPIAAPADDEKKRHFLWRF